MEPTETKTCHKCCVSKKRKMIQALLAVTVMIIGIYMFFGNDWGTPPAISGLGFFLAGFALWTPHCFFMTWIFKDK